MTQSGQLLILAKVSAALQSTGYRTRRQLSTPKNNLFIRRNRDEYDALPAEYRIDLILCGSRLILHITDLIPDSSGLIHPTIEPTPDSTEPIQRTIDLIPDDAGSILSCIDPVPDETELIPYWMGFMLCRTGLIRSFSYNPSQGVYNPSTLTPNMSNIRPTVSLTIAVKESVLL